MQAEVSILRSLMIYSTFCSSIICRLLMTFMAYTFPFDFFLTIITWLNPPVPNTLMRSKSARLGLAGVKGGGIFGTKRSLRSGVTLPPRRGEVKKVANGRDGVTKN